MVILVVKENARLLTRCEKLESLGNFWGISGRRVAYLNFSCDKLVRLR